MAKTTGTNGLDIQRNYICAAHYSVRDAIVRQVAVKPLPVSADGGVGSGGFWDAVALELRGIRRTVRFSGADIACSLPCDMAVVKALEAESDERDQSDVLRWELEASLPGPVAEYAYDFYEVDPGHLVDRRRYLAAAVRAETLAALRKAVRGAKLNPYIIDIDLFALTSVFQSNYRERLAEASVLVHTEPRRTKMILVSNSSYVNYAVVDFDAEGRGAADYAVMLRDETARLLTVSAELCNIPGSGDGAAIYLAGAQFADSDYSAAVLGALPRGEMLDPFRKVECAAGIMTDEQMKTYSPQLAVAIGLALRGVDEAV